MLRPVLFIACAMSFGCASDDRRAGEPYEGQPRSLIPTTPKTPDSDTGIDSSADSGDTDPSICTLSVGLSGALSGDRAYPGAEGTSCTVRRVDGTVTVTGVNPLVGEVFSLSLQLVGPGERDVIAIGSGPRFEVSNNDGTSNWNGVAGNCDYDIESHDQVDDTTYRLIGSGDCFGDFDAASGNENSRDLAFESFTYDFEFTW